MLRGLLAESFVPAADGRFIHIPPQEDSLNFYRFWHLACFM